MEFKLSMEFNLGPQDELKVNVAPAGLVGSVNFSLIFGFWLIVWAASIHA